MVATRSVRTVPNHPWANKNTISSARPPINENHGVLVYWRSCTGDCVFVCPWMVWYGPHGSCRNHLGNSVVSLSICMVYRRLHSPLAWWVVRLSHGSQIQQFSLALFIIESVVLICLICGRKAAQSAS